MLFKTTFSIYLILVTFLSSIVLAKPLSRQANDHPSASQVKAIARVVDGLITIFDRIPDFAIVNYTEQEQKYLDDIKLTEEEICILYLKNRKKRSFLEVISYDSAKIIKNSTTQTALQIAFVFNQFAEIFGRRPFALKSKIGHYTENQQAFMHKWYSIGSESYFLREYNSYRKNQIFIDSLNNDTKSLLFRELLDSKRRLDKAKNTARILNEFALLFDRGLTSENRQGFNAAEEAFYDKHEISSEVQLRRMYLRLIEDDILKELKLITEDNLKVLAKPYQKDELTIRDRKKIERERTKQLKENDIVAYMQELSQAIYEKELEKIEKIKLNTGFGIYTAKILRLREEIENLKANLNFEFNHYLQQGNYQNSDGEKFARKIKEFSLKSFYFKKLLEQLAPFIISADNFDCTQSVMNIKS